MRRKTETFGKNEVNEKFKKIGIKGSKGLSVAKTETGYVRGPFACCMKTWGGWFFAFSFLFSFISYLFIVS